MRVVPLGGGRREIRYEVPRDGLRAYGVAPGVVLFSGEKIGNTYRGRAVVFTKDCGKLGYDVDGVVSRNEHRIELTGYAPRVNRRCQKVGERRDHLVFELR
jgi:hypothetical protein